MEATSDRSAVAANAGVAAHARSLAEPADFWARAAHLIDWVTPPEQTLDDSGAPLYRWFTGGELNTCANALDRHVAAGRGDRTALIHDSAYTGEVATFTYAE
ncbi:MAG: acetyl-coenzyme A synthetase N-terminal domain-containing protein, partial [Candidatus Nanopelagicales bacterium]